MRRLCKVMTGSALLAGLVFGCGSSGEDGLVLRFIGFDATGIEQRDSASATSATVCVNTLIPGNTSTTINAIFINEQKANIHLTNYTVHFNDPATGLADFSASISGNPTLFGGQCSSDGRQCADAADCVSAEGSTGNTCDHTETTVEGIVLVDLAAKAHVNPQVFGQTTSLTVTFTGADDAHQTWVVAGGYAVVFNDRLTCGSASTGETPVATVTATSTPLPTGTPLQVAVQAAS